MKNFKCEICGKLLNTLTGLSLHVVYLHKEITKEEYYLRYISKDSSDGKCHRNGCNESTRYIGFGSGFLKYCSIKCAALSEEVRSKTKNTFIDKYGKDCALKVDEFKEKSRSTNIERFGSDYFFSSNIGKEKAKAGMISKYGEDNPTKCRSILEKRKLSCIEKFGKDHYMKTDEYKSDMRIKNFHRLVNTNRLKGLSTPIFDISEYTGVICKKYTFSCVKCNNIFTSTIDCGNIPLCPLCFPKNYKKSEGELEIYDFVKQYFTDIISGEKSKIYPLELDIYIPSKNLAIEFDGLYWHSELNKKDRHYHINKTLRCEDTGIDLIHIYEDEWNTKKDIVKSILKCKLGLVKNIISARKCVVKSVNKIESNNFLETNHIQGYLSGNHIGLYYNNELVSLLTYGKPRFNKKYEVEILRFCNKLNTIVTGGLSKLISKIECKSIISYVDRRYGNGKSYEKIGFSKVNNTRPSYYYMKNYYNRENRLNYRKSLLKEKLITYDSSLTEWENMKLNNYDRIWDCGNLVYELIRT